MEQKPEPEPELEPELELKLDSELGLEPETTPDSQKFQNGQCAHRAYAGYADRESKRHIYLHQHRRQRW